MLRTKLRISVQKLEVFLTIFWRQVEQSQLHIEFMVLWFVHTHILLLQRCSVVRELQL